MKLNFFRNRFSALAGGLLILLGGTLGLWAVTNLPAGDESPALQRDSPLDVPDELAMSPAPTETVGPIVDESATTEPGTAQPDTAQFDAVQPDNEQTGSPGAAASRPTLEAAINGTADSSADAPANTQTSNRPPEQNDALDTLIIGLDPTLPGALLTAAGELASTHDQVQVASAGAPTATVTLHWNAEDGIPFYRQVFAAATRFDIARFEAVDDRMADTLSGEPADAAPGDIDSEIGSETSSDSEGDTEIEPPAGPVRISLDWAEVQAGWAEPGERFPALVALTETQPALESLLGEPGAHVAFVDDREALIAAAWSPTPTLALLPFEQLHPRLTVLAIDGQNPVENVASFEPEVYPFTAPAYIQGHTEDGRLTRAQADWLQTLPNTNRDPDRLTVMAATGVTALTRMTAAEMETRGYDWPAAVVGPELAAADITVISNEVPFIEGCEPNIEPDNLVFCSKPEYMETLLAAGVSLVGLTGNHQNDFGWQGMRDSLAVYESYGVPVYGGGVDRDEAIAPLYVEHNGNRLAFLGVNSFGPASAWATETAPGSAPYDLAILSATIRGIKEQDLADVVLAEFQYQESYDVEPLWEQRNDFRAVVRAGADIVTGVQSHVPQALEFQNPALPEAFDYSDAYSDERLILYGLGNLFFDQMMREDTRENLIARHTFYEGRHLSTQLLTTVLYDYGQPRWAEPARHRAILERVLGASGLE